MALDVLCQVRSLVIAVHESRAYRVNQKLIFFFVQERVLPEPCLE